LKACLNELAENFGMQVVPKEKPVWAQVTGQVTKKNMMLKTGNSLKKLCSKELKVC
jgi:hypothetical protein